MGSLEKYIRFQNHDFGAKQSTAEKIAAGPQFPSSRIFHTRVIADGLRIDTSSTLSWQLVFSSKNLKLQL